MPCVTLFALGAALQTPGKPWRSLAPLQGAIPWLWRLLAQSRPLLFAAFNALATQVLHLGDISFDGIVDGQDITIMLSTWGVCDSDDPLDCLADFDGNGIVNGADLTTILSNWGVCSD